MTARKECSQEFKFDAISLAVEQSYTKFEAALGINLNLTTRWMKEQESDNGYVFRGNGKQELESLSHNSSSSKWRNEH